ncbi:hypothetical protein RA272_27755, partial [Pseudomonas syringae pv. tagetis]|uniref:hypothetical protein n=1 Tax=Pseudomonas syringae group genomosp. 7 TaxID=251699 RepID=UPI00376F7DFF
MLFGWVCFFCWGCCWLLLCVGWCLVGFVLRLLWVLGFLGGLCGCCCCFCVCCWGGWVCVLCGVGGGGVCRVCGWGFFGFLGGGRWGAVGLLWLWRRLFVSGFCFDVFCSVVCSSMGFSCFGWGAPVLPGGRLNPAFPPGDFDVAAQT